MRTRQFITKYSTKILVVALTLVATLTTLLLLKIGYEIFDIEIRLSEWIIGIVAPLLIAPAFTWMLFSLLKDLDVLEKDMRNLATHDHLTNLLTRRVFFEKSNDLIALSNRDNREISLLMVALDHFKEINDTFGHVAGDNMLKAFGHMANNNKRKTDLICRFGGEEFAFLLWGMSPSDAMNYAGNLHNRLRKIKIQHNGNTIQCTMSIGLTSRDNSNKDIGINELTQQADNALYLAKNEGRNRTVVYRDS